MKHSWFHRLAIATAGVAVLALTTLQGQEPTVSAQAADIDVEPGIEVQDSGPVHEAFAQPGAAVKSPGPIVTKAPPPAVPELPPETKPAGDNVVWLSGYWHYDEMKKDFIWISGFWRNAPEGREWQAGEWKKEENGYRYISGYWKKANTTNFQRNLPKPPDPVENGASTPAPHKDAVWVPGHWEHRPSGYAWRGGYWGESEDNLMWTPPQYVYGSSGYTYVPGYWDYCLEDRGLLYAPVYFTQPLWLNSDWCYRPRFAINIGFGGGWGWGWGGFYSSLFVGPYCNNFFYGSRYGGWWNWGCGYRPWYHGGKGCYNNVYNHYRHLNRHNGNWDRSVRNNYAAQAVGLNPRNTVAAGTAAATTRNVANSTPRGTLPGRDAVAGRVGNDVRRTGGVDARATNANGIVQPARKVLDSQNAARRVSPAPGGVNRVNDATARTTMRVPTGNTVTRGTASGDFRNNPAARGGIDGRTARGTSGMPNTRMDGALSRPGGVERSVGGMSRPPITDRGERSFSGRSAMGGADMGSRSFTTPSSRDFGGGRPSFAPPSGGSRGFSGGGGGRPSMGAPSGGSRGGISGGGGGLSGGRGGGGGGGGARGGRR